MNGPRELSVLMSLPSGSESLQAQEWDQRVAREAAHQARIEAAFDRADAFDRLGDAELALEWLDRADALSGGLTPTYRETRQRLLWEVVGGHHLRGVSILRRKA
jgi:hypothetical protein